MSIESLKDLYLDELGDLYDAETQAIRTLPRLADAAHAPELKDVLLRHRDESRLHVERLQLIFTHWGESAPARRSVGLAGIVEEADSRVNGAGGSDARDAAIIGVAQRIEHYEIAAYGCARTYARRLNRPDEARLLQETLDEEQRADRRLSEIAEAHVNDDARSEADLHEEPVRRLRYVDLEHLDSPTLGNGQVEVVSDAGEKLGTFDGLIVEASTSSPTPRYIVVNASGVFSWRRYLLPVGNVRLDEDLHALRIGIEKAIAARYPPFDRDEFDTMDDDALQVYEGKLLASFGSRRKSARGDRIPAVAPPADPPEWLMTGVWMTLPPSAADRLPERARNFANEFAPQRKEDISQPHQNPKSNDDDTPVPPPRGEKLR